MSTPPSQIPQDPPAGTHPVPERHDTSHDHRLLYGLVGLVVVVLLVVGLVSYQQAENDKDAKRKAAQLQQLFTQIGVREAPSTKVLARSLGTNGGAVCKTSGDDLPQAILDQQLSAGGGGVGARPIIVDKDVLNSQLAIISVYCPDRAAAFKDYFRDYKLDDVIRTG
jgi:hypothetical protein